MRQTRFALLLAACLLSGFTAKAQNTAVEGNKLNIGGSNTVTNDGSGAIGHSNKVWATNSFAVGYCDTIDAQQANNSFTLGTSNRIGGSSSFGFGQDVKVSGAYGLGLGRFLKATGNYDCMVIGSGFWSLGLKPKRYFENQHDYSLMIGFHSIRPTLTVGPSPNDYPQGDTLGKTGKVAIGDVPVPDIGAKLHVRSDYGEDAGIILEPKDPEASKTFIRMRDADHGIEVDKKGVMNIRSMSGQDLGSLILHGRVGINSANESESYALAVNGGILTDEVFIKNVEEWYDLVFAKDYKLLPLAGLRCYIEKNGHLPDIPSGVDVTEKGYNMVEMQGLLLKKIEELTLYTIKQQEEIDNLKQLLEEQKRK